MNALFFLEYNIFIVPELIGVSYLLYKHERHIQIRSEAIVYGRKKKKNTGKYTTAMKISRVKDRQKRQGYPILHNHSQIMGQEEVKQLFVTFSLLALRLVTALVWR